MGKSESNLNKQLVSLSPDVLVDLYEIDFSSLQPNFEILQDLYGISIGADSVYRFCPMINGSNPVYWQGKGYQPLPIKASGFEHKSDGRLPRPTLTIANPDGVLSQIVHSNSDFTNCKVTRKRTYVRFLDDENFQNRNLNESGKNPFGEADPNSHLPDDVYFINKKTPLSLPPNFDDLPKPISEANTDDNLDDFDIEKLLKKETNSNNETSKKQKINKSLNKSVIDKIKNN